MLIALPVLDRGEGRRRGTGDQLGVPPKRPAADRERRKLVDSHGRAIRDLRLSITDRCNFRCVYCMEPDATFLDRGELLTVEQMALLVRVCASLGVEKVRLTGGEPTLHPDLPRIIESVARAAPVEVAMTTNGSRLDRESLRRWRDAGLTRLTVSIDSADPVRFAQLTRSKVPLARVLDGIRAAREFGPGPLKINSVVIRGVNDRDVVGIAALARSMALEARFIEFMPLDGDRSWDRSRVVPADEILEQINHVFPLRPLGREDPSSTSEVFEFVDGSPGRIGTIAPVSRPFCGACSRLRITADGKVRPCLFSRDEWDLRPILRTEPSEVQPLSLSEFLLDAMWTKQAGHGIGAPAFHQPDRPMWAIGG